MATMTIPLAGFDPWCVDIDYHRTMAATLTACRAVKNGAMWLTVAKDFWTVSKDFRTLLSELDRVVEAPHSDLQAAVLKLRELYKSANKTMDIARRHGLHNRTLTGASLRALADCNLRLLDIIERFELSLNPATVEATRKALEEYERGETVSMDSLV
jgi:hypothetical protein